MALALKVESLVYSVKHKFVLTYLLVTETAALEVLSAVCRQPVGRDFASLITDLSAAFCMINHSFAVWL
jgi:hypothetical protein